MLRFASPQPDLFTSQAGAGESTPTEDPMTVLTAVLAELRATDELPWPTITIAMQEEYRVLGLARQAGPAGEALAAAILEETERLLAAAD